MRTRVQRQPPAGSARRHPVPLELSSASDTISPQVVSDFMGWRVLDVSTKLLTHQPLEPSRALANRMYNERTMLQATVAQVSLQLPSSPSSPTSEVPKNGKGKANATPKQVERQTTPVSHVEGSQYRQWTVTRLVPYGLEALNAFQLPAIALAKSPFTDEMLATMVALLYRQCRVTAGERKTLPSHLTPLFYDSAEEVDVTVAVPFIIALAEQELRGAMPGLTPRVTLTCTLIALSVLKLEMQQEHATDTETVGAPVSPSSSSVPTPLEETGQGADKQPDMLLLTAKVARIGSTSEALQLGHHLCKSVNRGLLGCRRKGNRSGRSSLSSSTRTSTLLGSSRQSQPRGSLRRDWVLDTDTANTNVAPLSAADLDDLVDALFVLPGETGTAHVPTLTVSDRSLRKVLFALTTALWAVYEVAIPLAILLSSRAENDSEAIQRTTDKLRTLASALVMLLRDDSHDVTSDLTLGFAEAMVVDDFAKVLTSATAGNLDGVSSILLASIEHSTFQKSLRIHGQGHAPPAAFLWMQSLDWVMQITEAAVTAEYFHEC